MRSHSRARRARCVLALGALIVAVTTPAVADKGKHAKGSVAECASFDQKDGSASTVDFTVTNACTITLECSVTWSVTCAPDSPKKRSKKSEGASFNLASNDAKVTTASADRCGDDGWAIDDVSWSCAPAKD